MKVGILGAGQLARMMILTTKHLGIDFVLMCQEVTATTRDLAEHIVADFSDQQALAAFCDAVDVVTFESENIEAEAVDFILSRRPLFPGRKALLTAQDRLLEKRLFNQLGIATNDYMAVDCFDDVLDAAEQFSLPLVLKARRLGYDGKHQYRIADQADLDALRDNDWSGFLAEAFVDFSHEVSIIGVRNGEGAIRCYDLCHNHHQRGILRETKNVIDDPLFSAAELALTQVMRCFDYVGVLTIEFFVANGTLVANEIAPRVHNSGHWTIEGAKVSQFENHVRAIVGLPLGAVTSLTSCTMTNAIGQMPERQPVMAQGGYYHDYQKAPRPGRKLGHVTFIDNVY